MQIDNMDEVRKVFVEFENIFTSVYDEKKKLEEQIKLKEDETQDYLHELELAKLNAMEIMKVSHLLIKCRKERRKLKNKLELINTTKGFVDLHITKGITNEVQQLIENIDKLKANQENKHYTARVVQDLKCTKENKINEKNMCRKVGN